MPVQKQEITSYFHTSIQCHRVYSLGIQRKQIKKYCRRTGQLCSHGILLNDKHRVAKLEERYDAREQTKRRTMFAWNYINYKWAFWILCSGETMMHPCKVHPCSSTIRSWCWGGGMYLLPCVGPLHRWHHLSLKLFKWSTPTSWQLLEGRRITSIYKCYSCIAADRLFEQGCHLVSLSKCLCIHLHTALLRQEWYRIFVWTLSRHLH